MKVKILIVDDELLQLNIFGKIIRRYRPDYEVVTTHQPMEALELLQTQSFNALMTDVKMPQMNGIELIREARLMNIEPLEIIILSGFDDFQYARSAISFEVLEYMLKPIDGASLQRALTKLEEKLEGEEMRRRIENAYSTMNSHHCATALFKKASGLMITPIEEKTIQRFGDWIRMVLVENCDEINSWLSAMPSSTCVEPLAQQRHLAFVPISLNNFGEHVPPIVKGVVTVSSPCRTDEVKLRWEELQQYADTARRMGMKLLLQKEWDHRLLEDFILAIRSQNAGAVCALAGTLRLALQGGHMTFAALSAAAEAEITRQVREELLPNIYAQRKQDLLKVMVERISNCDNPEKFCETVGAMFTSFLEESSGSFMQNVRIYIDAHYSGSCSLKEVSRAFHYSTAHFSRLFSAEFGCNYTRWLADYRLEKARDLLISTTYSVSEIGSRVGIGDAGYLIRQFSRKYGVSPEKFRRQG